MEKGPCPVNTFRRKVGILLLLKGMKFPPQGEGEQEADLK